MSKRILELSLLVCLVLAFVVSAVAASRPDMTCSIVDGQCVGFCRPGVACAYNYPITLCGCVN